MCKVLIKSLWICFFIFLLFYFLCFIEFLKFLSAPKKSVIEKQIKKNVKVSILLNTSGIYYVSSNNAAFSFPVLLQSSEEWMERRAVARLDDTGTPSETESEDEPILYRDTLPDQGVITPPSGFASPGADPNPQNLVRSHS